MIEDDKPYKVFDTSGQETVLLGEFITMGEAEAWLAKVKPPKACISYPAYLDEKQ